MLRHAVHAAVSILRTSEAATGSCQRCTRQMPTVSLHRTAAMPSRSAELPAAAAAAPDALRGQHRHISMAAPPAADAAAAAQRQPAGAAVPPTKRRRTTLKQATLTDRPPPLASAARQRRRGGNGSSSAAAPEEGAPGWTQLGDGARVWYGRGAWPAAEATDITRRLQEEVPWECREVRVMGRTVNQPRLIAYMADDPSLTYTYSSLRLTPSAWSPAARQVKEALERMTGASFDSCLLNLYRDGGDHMGWHSDNEALYGREPTIGSASFGATRDFMLRHNQQRDRKLRFQLGNGDALVMAGTAQDHWMHAVPKRATVRAPRINLTFRKVVNREKTWCGKPSRTTATA